MKTAIVAIAGLSAASLASTSALAEGHEDKCFDKGTLTYVDCPAEPEPVVEEEPVMMESEDGFYIGARGGVAWVEDIDYTSDTTLGAPVVGDTFHTGYDTGFIVSGMIGYTFSGAAGGVDIRPELEIGYLSADVESLSYTVFSDPDPEGDVSVLFGFVNLFADIPVTADLDIIVGGGIGLGNVSLDNEFENGDEAVDDSATAFGYNIGAGLGYEVAEDVTIEAMYRYMSFLDAEVDTSFGVPVSNDVDVSAHTATIGLRFDF